MDEKQLDSVLRYRKSTRIFWGDMTDIFQDGVPEEFVARCFAVAALTPHITHMFLTKRPWQMRHLLALPETFVRIDGHEVSNDQQKGEGRIWVDGESKRWPLPNVLLGASAENQQYADERRHPMAALALDGWRTFVSYEPALGNVDWAGWEFLSLLISGGESGAQARASHVGWHREVRDFCVKYKIPYFFKQWGEWSTQLPEDNGIRPGSLGPERAIWINFDGSIAPCGNAGDLSLGADNIALRVGKKAAGHLLDGREWHQFPEARP